MEKRKLKQSPWKMWMSYSEKGHAVHWNDMIAFVSTETWWTFSYLPDLSILHIE